jgi:signal transduction histidine kinase
MSYAAGSRWYRGLSFRLNAWYAGVLILVFGAAALGARRLARSSIDDEQIVSVQSELELHRSRIESSGLAGLERFVAARREHTSTRWFVRVSDAAGRTLLFDGPEAQLAFDERDLEPRDGIQSVQARAHPEEPWRVLSARVTGRLWLQLGVADGPRLERLAAVERSFWLLLLFGITLGSLGGYVVTRRALSPLRSLAATSQRVVEEGDLTARVPVRNDGDELDELSILFNRVLERNQRLVEGMRQALDNVAHDLRTPLSSLRSSAELALQHEDDTDRLREALADCVEDSERVLRMLHTLMDISEAETGVMHLSVGTFALDALVREALDVYQHVAQESEIELRCEAGREVRIEGDRQRLAQAIGNLVDNALKYTDRGGRVTVSVARAGDWAHVFVSDTGTGIEAAHLDKIWQRLYRADQSRSRHGLGLGLSFVKAIVEAHGGRARAVSTPGQGSTFELILPTHVSGGRRA